MNRREAIRKGLLFCTALIGGGCHSESYSRSKPSYEPGGMHFLAVGDFGTGDPEQRKIANTMASFAAKLPDPLTAVLALGDNFYGPFSDERFISGFEKMYDGKILNCPFYACLGNHDYEPLGGSLNLTKADLQLKYAEEHPDSRWKMPGRWYVVELPNAANPLVRLIVLDGNRGRIGEKAFAEQTRFLEQEVAKGTKAPWTWIANHYPMFSDGISRGDNRNVSDAWGELVKASNASLFLSGHDHSLQHLQVAGHNTSFLISGGGGRALHKTRSSGRGFSYSGLGFHHIRVNEKELTVQIIDEWGQRLHSFKRSLLGEITTLT